VTTRLGILILAALLLTGCDEPKTPVDVLILLDGSRSISASERLDTFETTRTWLSRLPNGGKYAVAILDGEVGRILLSGTRQVDNNDEQNEYDATLEQYRKKLPDDFSQWMSEDPTRGNSTCILKTLIATGRYFQHRDGAQRRVVFVLSDMIEDCDHGGKRVELCGAAFSRLLKGLSPHPELQANEIYAILPVRRSASRGCSPDIGTIRDTWAPVGRSFNKFSINFPEDLPPGLLLGASATQ
jgi:hypothetical protein